MTGTISSRIGVVAGAVGRGLAAGAIGTLALTISSAIEARLRKREPSRMPAEAVERVFDLQPESEKAEARLSTAVHWDYGTTWGAARGLLDVAGLSGAAAALAHFAAVWGTGLVALPTIGVAPPPTRWGGREVAIDALHHAIYAATTSFAYEAISARRLSVSALVGPLGLRRRLQPAMRLAGAEIAYGLRRVPLLRQLAPRTRFPRLLRRAAHLRYGLGRAPIVGGAFA
jgi:hypothetical protein